MFNFDDTIQEKKWTDESDIMCWHFDHTIGKSVRGINMLNALYYSNEISIPVAFEIIDFLHNLDTAQHFIESFTLYKVPIGRSKK